MIADPIEKIKLYFQKFAAFFLAAGSAGEEDGQKAEFGLLYCQNPENGVILFYIS